MGYFKEHLETAAVFDGMSKTVQNEPLEYMLAVSRGHIWDEFSAAKCVTIQADQAAVVSTQTQPVCVLRYFDLKQDKEKLIAQGYDGTQTVVLQKTFEHLKSSSSMTVLA